MLRPVFCLLCCSNFVLRFVVILFKNRSLCIYVALYWPYCSLRYIFYIIFWHKLCGILIRHFFVCSRNDMPRNFDEYAWAAVPSSAFSFMLQEYASSYPASIAWTIILLSSGIVALSADRWCQRETEWGTDRQTGRQRERKHYNKKYGIALVFTAFIVFVRLNILDIVMLLITGMIT